MEVTFTKRAGVAGFHLVPETATESNYLMDLDWDNLVLVLTSVGGLWSLESQQVVPSVRHVKAVSSKRQASITART